MLMALMMALAGLAPKIVLAEKGSKKELTIQQGDGLIATLYWKTRVDLDLHCIGEDSKGSDFHIFFRNRCSLESYPHVYLTEDKGVGDKVEASGFNQEDLYVGDLGSVRRLLVAVNIFSKQTNFAQYGGNVTVRPARRQAASPAKSGGFFSKVFSGGSSSGSPQFLEVPGAEQIEVSLNAKETGSNCIITYVDNAGSKPVVHYVNQIMQSLPGSVRAFLETWRA